MDKELKISFLNHFLNERNKLLQALSRSDSWLCQSDESPGDEHDVAAEERDRMLMLRMKQRQSLYLRKVEAALARLRRGTFLECSSCQGDIDPRRLAARPTTTHCVECKETSEKSENSFADRRNRFAARPQ